METADNAQDKSLNADDISRFLRLHPHFFEEHPHLLADIVVPSPHGSGTISLTERQQLAQRDKIRVLEVKLAELIAFAKENDMTGAKIHALSVKLLSSVGLNQVVQTTQQFLLNDFNVSQVFINVWQPNIGQDKTHEIFASIDDPLREWALGLNSPFCGEVPKPIKNRCEADISSCCVVPLKRYQEVTTGNTAVGLLMLGSTESKRFKTDMGSVYLSQIGGLVSAAISQAL